MHTYSLSKNSGIFINFEVGTTNNIHRKFHKYIVVSFSIGLLSCRIRTERMVLI